MLLSADAVRLATPGATGGLSASADSLPLLAARVLAAFLGGFAILNMLGDAVSPGFNANGWWIAWHPFSAAASQVALLAAAMAMLAFALRPHMGRRRRIVTQLLVAAILLGTLCDAAAFFALAGRRGIAAGTPVPLSLVVALVLVWLLAMIRQGGMVTLLGDHDPHSHGHATAKRDHATRRRLAVLLFVGGLAVGFPLAQMVFFGRTDYRRPADAIVVFGAGVNRDGSCSEALADRVATACRLYQQGCADRLIFSGGPGRGNVHETEGMRRLAVSLGVPDEAIIRDEQGLSTQATVDNTPAIMEELGAHRILAVSHWYHLPRVKMTYQRAGLEVYTVPAEQRRNLRDWPWLISREVAALWAYYLHPLAA